MKASLTCVDCGILHSRDRRASLCLPCKKARRLRRNGTPKYMAYQDKYRHSAKRKIGVAVWNELNREHIAERQHQNYLRRKAERVPKLIHCATLLCTGVFIRPRGSHRLFCEECQVALWVRSYLRALATRMRKPWRKVA